MVSVLNSRRNCENTPIGNHPGDLFKMPPKTASPEHPPLMRVGVVTIRGCPVRVSRQGCRWDSEDTVSI